MRQVGYLQRLYRDARSTEHKIHVFLFADALQVHVVKNVALGRQSNSFSGLRP